MSINKMDCISILRELFKNSFTDANSLKQELREKGFKHAFVVAFMNGERINLQKAINLAEK